MIKVFSFKHIDPDSNETDPTYHETEDIACRAACAYILEHQMEGFDLKDEDQRFFLRQFSAHIEAGDYRAATLAYNAQSASDGWGENLVIDSVNLIQEHQLEVFERVAAFRKTLAAAEESAD